MLLQRDWSFATIISPPLPHVLGEIMAKFVINAEGLNLIIILAAV
jgi:hypothetical protein